MIRGSSLAALLLAAGLVFAAGAVRAGEAEWQARIEEARQLLAEGDNLKARTALEAAEREAAGAFAITDPRAIETLRLLAEANRRLDRVVAAEDFHKQILGVLSMGLGDDDPATIAQYVEMARFYALLKNPAKSREHYGKAYDGQKKKPELYPDWPLIAADYAAALLRTREAKTADEVLTAALEAERRLHGAETPAMAVLLRASGEAKLALQDDAAAEEAFARSLGLLTRLNPADPAVPELQRRLAEIADRRNNEKRRSEAAAAAEAERTRIDAAAQATSQGPADWEYFAPPPGWRNVKVFHGSAPLTTEVLAITGARWRIVWNTFATSEPRFSSLGITIFRAGEALSTAHLDIEGGNRDSAEYPGPGRFHLQFNTANITFQAAVQESGEAPAAEAAPADETPRQPSIDQAAFEEMITSYSIRFRNAGSDLQRSSLRAKRARDLLALASSTPDVAGWTAVVASRGFTAEGDAYLAVRLDGTRKPTLTTLADPAADVQTKTLIAKGSPLHDSLALLKEGDRVAFSGRLLTDEQGADGLLVLAKGEQQAMTEPAFLFRFASIQRLP